MSTESRDEDPLDAIRALHERERELARAKRELIARARSRGCSWSEIGEALHVSKQAAWQLYNTEVTALLDRTARRSGLTEDAAMELARRELAEARRERRSRPASK